MVGMSVYGFALTKQAGPDPSFCRFIGHAVKSGCDFGLTEEPQMPQPPDQ
jgi:hypothetical protein